MIRITGKVPDRHGMFVPHTKSQGSMRGLPMPDFVAPL